VFFPGKLRYSPDCVTAPFGVMCIGLMREAAMTSATDLYAIAARFRELARKEANGPLRKRLVDWAWRCDKMAKALDANDAKQRRLDAAPHASGAGE